MLYTHPTVNKVVVVTRPDDYSEEMPCAFMSLKEEINTWDLYKINSTKKKDYIKSFNAKISSEISFYLHFVLDLSKLCEYPLILLKYATATDFEKSNPHFTQVLLSMITAPPSPTPSFNKNLLQMQNWSPWIENQLHYCSLGIIKKKKFT